MPALKTGMYHQRNAKKRHTKLPDNIVEVEGRGGEEAADAL